MGGDAWTAGRSPPRGWQRCEGGREAWSPVPHSHNNLTTGWGGIAKRANDEIAIVVSSLHTLKAKGVAFLFTDRHAYLNAALYSSDLGHLDRINWPLLQRRDLKRDGNDLDKVERYQ